MASTSLTSGKPSISGRTLSAPRASAGSTGGPHSAKYGDEPFEWPSARFPQGIHVLAPGHLRGAQQHRVFQVRIKPSQRQAANDLLLEQRFVHSLGIVDLRDEFVKERPRETRLQLAG